MHRYISFVYILIESQSMYLYFHQFRRDSEIEGIPASENGGSHLVKHKEYARRGKKKKKKKNVGIQKRKDCICNGQQDFVKNMKGSNYIYNSHLFNSLFSVY